MSVSTLIAADNEDDNTGDKSPSRVGRVAGGVRSRVGEQIGYEAIPIGESQPIKRSASRRMRVIGRRSRLPVVEEGK